MEVIEVQRKNGMRKKTIYSAPEKAERKEIFQYKRVVLFRFDPAFETPQHITALTEPLWRTFIQSSHYKSQKLKMKRQVLDQLYITNGLGLLERALVEFPKNHNKIPSWSVIERMNKFCKSVRMYKEYTSSECNPLYAQLEETRLRPYKSFFKPQVFAPLARVAERSPAFIRYPWIQITKEDEDTGEEIRISVDENDPQVRKRAEMLKVIDHCWRLHKIKYKPLLEDGTFSRFYTEIRTQPYCVFTEDLENGGRIYTAGGHQNITREERATIEISKKTNRYKCCEIDEKCLHPFMVYALKKGIHLKEDAYKLLTDEEMNKIGWNKEQKEAFRDLGKTAFSAVLNARTPEEAVQGCNNQLNTKTSSKDANGDFIKKDKKSYAEAVELNKAVALIGGAKFSDLCELVLQRHPDIYDILIDGTSTGLELQKIDSDITLRVCFHFARQEICCLPIHDSYIVPLQYEAELRMVLRREYARALGFAPKMDKKWPAKKVA